MHSKLAVTYVHNIYNIYINFRILLTNCLFSDVDAAAIVLLVCFILIIVLMYRTFSVRLPVFHLTLFWDLL